MEANLTLTIQDGTSCKALTLPVGKQMPNNMKDKLVVYFKMLMQEFQEQLSVDIAKYCATLQEASSDKEDERDFRQTKREIPFIRSLPPLPNEPTVKQAMSFESFDDSRGEYYDDDEITVKIILPEVRQYL